MSCLVNRLPEFSAAQFKARCLKLCTAITVELCSFMRATMIRCQKTLEGKVTLYTFESESIRLLHFL